MMPCPPPGDLLNPGIEPRSPILQADSLLSEPPGKPIIPICHISNILFLVDGHFDSLYSLAIIIHVQVSVCMCVCVCVCVCVFISLGCVARSRISGFYGNSIPHM